MCFDGVNIGCSGPFTLAISIDKTGLLIGDLYDLRVVVTP